MSITCLIVFVHSIIWTFESQKIDINISNDTIVCDDPVSCALFCDPQNGCNNVIYHCYNTPICSIICSKAQNRSITICNNLTISVKSHKLKTITNIQCNNDECNTINIDCDPISQCAIFKVKFMQFIITSLYFPVTISRKFCHIIISQKKEPQSKLRCS